MILMALVAILKGPKVNPEFPGVSEDSEEKKWSPSAALRMAHLPSVEICTIGNLELLLH